MFSITLRLLLALHVGFELGHGFSSLLFLEKQTVAGHFQFTTFAKRLGRILEVFEEVVDEATGIDLGHRRVAILETVVLTEAIAVEDLDQFREDSPLVVQALYRHFDLELTRGFQAKFYSLSHPFHDDLR